MSVLIEKATLYIVSTPIGNLGDMSFRAVDVLGAVDVILAEDTRHSAKLLNHFQIRTSMLPFHEHNEDVQLRKVLKLLADGGSIALISDAGTPLISDPGYRLVHEVINQGIRVIPIPGPCAAIVALSAAGLPSDRFIFEGFLPSKSQARMTRLEALKFEDRTLIFYEAPHRIMPLIKDLIAVFGGDRIAVIARELTKLFETIHKDHLVNLLTWLELNKEQQQGEFVVLIEGYKEAKALESSDEHALKVLLQELPLKQAVNLASAITGKSKNTLYKLALEEKTYTFNRTQ